MRVKPKQTFFAVVAALLLLTFLEMTLGLLMLVFPAVETLLASSQTRQRVLPTVPDDRLGHRPNPAYPGHDWQGFRNSHVPVSANTVALGDSQTYGTGVAPEQAWPRHLARQTGQTVYSMAYGGYGPAHSLVLWDEAMALSPMVVIEAFYAGNDLFDSFDLVYNRGQLPELKSPDPQLQEQILAAEESEPLAQRVSRMFQQGNVPVPADGFSLRHLLSQHSKIYSLLRRTWHESMRLLHPSGKPPQDAWEKAKAFAAMHPEYCQVFSDGPFNTIFTSEYRLSALDLGDPRIDEGLQIALRAIQRLQALATARHIRFLVVLIPTKETVFQPFWHDPSTSYRQLIEHESRMWRITREVLDRHGIDSVEALPALREQLARGIQPYPVSHDGHPNDHGHQAIAQLVATHLAPARRPPGQPAADVTADADRPRH
jgi:hypothetical protein